MRIEKPVRVSRTYEQTIHATPDQAFPLYCPVREADWVPGWDPVAVFSDSGVAEEGCAFVTQDGKTESVWLVTVHDPKLHRVEMIKCTPGVTICRLRIGLKPKGKTKTTAAITYSHTSLGPEGDHFVEEFTKEYYEGFMDVWETAMNHYLDTGDCLDPEA